MATTFQRRALSALRQADPLWVIDNDRGRADSNGHIALRHEGTGERMAITSTPSNEDDALKAVLHKARAKSAFSGIPEKVLRLHRWLVERHGAGEYEGSLEGSIAVYLRQSNDWSRTNAAALALRKSGLAKSLSGTGGGKKRTWLAELPASADDVLTVGAGVVRVDRPEDIDESGGMAGVVDVTGGVAPGNEPSATVWAPSPVSTTIVDAVTAGPIEPPVPEADPIEAPHAAREVEQAGEAASVAVPVPLDEEIAAAIAAIVRNRVAPVEAQAARIDLGVEGLTAALAMATAVESKVTAIAKITALAVQEVGDVKRQISEALDMLREAD